MTQDDRTTALAASLVAAIALWSWWSSAPRGLGAPGLGTGKDRGGGTAKPARSSSRTTTRSTPQSAAGKGSGYIDVTGPRLVP